MSADDTPAASLCHGSQAMTLFPILCGKVNNSVYLLEKNMHLAFLLDYLSVKKDKEVHKAIQKHEFYCESLEMANLRKSQETQEDERETEIWINTIVKNSFRDVCSRLAHCYSEPEYQYVTEELPKEDVALQQLFTNSLQKIVTQHFIHKKEETVPEEIDNALDVILNQWGTKLKEMDSKIEKCTREMKKIKSKMEQLPVEVEDEAAQSYFKEAEIRQDTLQQEFDQLSVQLNKLLLKNRDKERQIQEGTDIVMDESGYMFQCFDDFMETEQNDLETREEELLRLEEELMKTETLCVALEVEYTEVMERRKMAEVARLEEMRILQLQTRAAIIAQAWWRGYRLRKAIKNPSKKKATKATPPPKTK